MIGTGAALLISAVVGVAGSALSANAQADGVKKGIAAEQVALDKKLALIEKQDTQARADIAPWREAGKVALDKLQAGIADGSFDPSNFEFKTDPGYQFRLDQGTKAIERSASARGNLLSGDTAVALQKYGQGFASNEYDRAYARNAAAKSQNYNALAGVAGTGQRAVEVTTNNALNSTNNAVGAVGANANAQNQGQRQIGQVWGNAFQNMGGAINTGLENNLLFNALGAA